MPTVIRKFLLLLIKNRSIEFTREAIMRYCRRINSLDKSVRWVSGALVSSLAMLRSNLLPKSLKLTDGRYLDQLWTSVVDCLNMNDWQLQQYFLPSLYRV